MRNIMLKTLITVFALITVSQATAKDMKDLTNELRNKINTYKNSNIKPQMDSWKNEIDKNIKSNDLAKLNELRLKAAAMKAEAKKNFDNLKDENANIPRKKGHKDENREMMRDDMKEIGQDLKEIVQNNKVFFKEFFDDAKPKLRKWRDEIEDIVEEWHESNEEDLDNAAKDKESFHNGMHNRMEKMMGGKKQAVARILLYNGQDEFMDDAFLKNGIESKAQNSKSSNYPNPFTEQTTIKFNLPESGITKISIVDEFGKVIEEVQNTNLDKGEHIINYTPKRNLNNGLYFYRIESGNYKDSGKLIYKK